MNTFTICHFKAHLSEKKRQIYLQFQTAISALEAYQLLSDHMEKPLAVAPVHIHCIVVRNMCYDRD